MKRRFARRSLRKPRVAWFNPRLGADPDGIHTDAETSCWADVTALLFPVGSTLGPTLINSPIVTNLTETIDPDVAGNVALRGHPLTESWTVRRIVGQIGITGISLEQVDTALRGITVHLGVICLDSIGDVSATLDPRLNDSSLARWLWLDHEFICDSSTVCIPCPSTGAEIDGTFDGDIDGTFHGAFSGSFPGPQSASQLFGVPIAKVVPVDIKVRRRVRPESKLYLAMSAEVAVGEEDHCTVHVRPWLRALISKTV